MIFFGDEYKYSLHTPTRTFTFQSIISMEDAKIEAHMMAYRKGCWRPRKLWQAWWQFWRPTEHNEVELYALDLEKGKQ